MKSKQGFQLKKNALVLIDVQKGFFDFAYWGERNNPEFEIRTKGLLEFYRANELSVIHVQHLSRNPSSPLRPGQGGADFVEDFEPHFGEKVFQKEVNSAFIGTNLEIYLKSQCFNSLTLVGFTSDHCVSTTARMAKNLGFEVFIPSDCTATFDRRLLGTTYPADLVHSVSLASLNEEFANIISADDLMLELVRCRAQFPESFN